MTIDLVIVLATLLVGMAIAFGVGYAFGEREGFKLGASCVALRLRARALTTGSETFSLATAIALRIGRGRIGPICREATQEHRNARHVAEARNRKIRGIYAVELDRLGDELEARVAHGGSRA